jgi:hypothetical protein
MAALGEVSVGDPPIILERLQETTIHLVQRKLQIRLPKF